MAGIRSLLARVTRLEGNSGPAQSPFERIYGSFEEFTQVARAGIEAGTLDRRDGVVLLEIIRRWHADRAWDLWQ